MRSFRSHLTFANVIACLALFIALGGASYAATQLPKNSITSKQIKKGSIQLADLSKGAKTKLHGASGPVGKPGPVGPTGPRGPAGPQTSTLPSGETLRGSFNLDSQGPVGASIGADISFGLNLTQAPKVEIIRDSGPPTGNCPGSVTSPQAARGFLCVYEISNANGEPLTVCDAECEVAPGANPWGAELYLFAKKAGRFFSDGTWAVTAP